MKFLIAILPVLLVSATAGSAFAFEKVEAVNIGACQSSSLASPSGNDSGERTEALQRCTTIQTEPQALSNSSLTASNPSAPETPDAVVLTPENNIAPQPPKRSFLTDSNPPAEIPSPSLCNLDPSSAVQPRPLWDNWFFVDRNPSPPCARPSVSCHDFIYMRNGDETFNS